MCCEMRFGCLRNGVGVLGKEVLSAVDSVVREGESEEKDLSVLSARRLQVIVMKIESGEIHNGGN